jgi:hypothetical protein
MCLRQLLSIGYLYRNVLGLLTVRLVLSEWLHIPIVNPIHIDHCGEVAQVMNLKCQLSLDEFVDRRSRSDKTNNPLPIL